MIVLAREVLLCKCSTESWGELEGRECLRFVSGAEPHLGLLDATYHDDSHRLDFRARLARGEYWLVGFVGDRMATYTWLHTRSLCEYRYLDGCVFALPDAFGFGYDAWTAPELRGLGLRRRAFVEELRILRGRRKAWEASFFVAHQFDGAQRSLARAGIHIVPLWRIALGSGRQLVAESVTPSCEVAPAGNVRPRAE